MKIPSFLRGLVRHRGGGTRKAPERTPPPSKCQKQGVGRQTTVASKPPGPQVAETLPGGETEVPMPGGYTKHDKVAMEADLNRDHYKPDPRDPMLCDTQYSSKHSSCLAIFISCNETPNSPVAETLEFLGLPLAEGGSLLLIVDKVAETQRTGRFQGVEPNIPAVPRVGSNVPSGRDLIIRLNSLDPRGWQESAGEGGDPEKIRWVPGMSAVLRGEVGVEGDKIFLVSQSRPRPATDRSPGKIGVDIPAVLIRIEGKPYGKPYKDSPTYGDAYAIPGKPTITMPPLTADELYKIFSRFRDSYKGIPAETLAKDSPDIGMTADELHSSLSGMGDANNYTNTLDTPDKIADNDWEPSVDLAFYNLEHSDDEVMQCPYCLCWTYVLTGERCGNCGKDVTTFTPSNT